MSSTIPYYPTEDPGCGGGGGSAARRGRRRGKARRNLSRGGGGGEHAPTRACVVATATVAPRCLLGSGSGSGSERGVLASILAATASARGLPLLAISSSGEHAGDTT